MAQTPKPTEEPPKKSGLPMIIGLVLALIGGGGGFYAVYTGLFLGPASSDSAAQAAPRPIEDIAFVPLEPLVVSLKGGDGSRHLRFRAQLEVDKAHLADVEALLPRIVDVLNGYLRALRAGDLEGAAALIRLRSQMLRRVQIVTGPGRVNNLLVMEFVLS